MPKIVVGMSGGVDSAVSAYLLKEAGYDVVGITIRSWISSEGKDSRCCEIDDARRVAWKIGMPYHVVNSVANFKRMITDPFIEAYINGLTPNPCVFCNRCIKWEKLIEYAGILGADLVATGHYASIVRKENGRLTVKKAVHDAKDQTYMLYRLTQEQLAKTVMPLGKLSKEEVREIARKAELPVAAKADSQEICFVTEGNYADYIEENACCEIPGEGYFVDEDGCILGKHNGIIRYTVGQRKGLGLALGYPAYIKEIDAKKNVIVVAGQEGICSRELICNDLNFMGIQIPAPGEEIDCKVKVRYHHPGQEARIKLLDEGRLRITFKAPVRAAAPGQSAVFYDTEDCLIGGGIISRVIY